MEAMKLSDCWNILGIEPTDNKREVRSAYAAKSKLFHLEENPEEFARLNQAYQAALKYVSENSKGALAPNIMSATGNETDSNKEQEITNQSDSKNTTIETKDREEEIQSEERGSLLDWLQQAEDKQIQESKQKGALKKFIEIFENAKETGKNPRAEVWKDFFLSEEFLKEQYEEGFASGMLHYLSQWSMEGNYNGEALPSNFLLELAIAYALLPEEIDNISSNKIDFGINASGNFYGRVCAASLWKKQSGRGSLPIRILYKPENLVRLRSFSDYMRLRSLKEKNQLTLNNKDNWSNIINRGRVNHLFELRGRGNREIYEETRSDCLIRLYIFWISNDKVPDCVLEYMYKEYDLKNVEHSSSKKIYGPLKQEILKRYPDIEQALFSAESRIQMETDWYRDFTKIIADNHTNYDKGVYEETDNIKERVRELFERPEWTKINNSQELFERMYLQLYNRVIIPESLAKTLIDFYSGNQHESDNCSDITYDRWEEPQKVSVIVETLIQSMAYNRRIRDVNGLKQVGCEGTGIEDINDNNRDFWYYYLMVGYGFRRADLEISGAQSAKYALGSNCYLPLYIDYMYHASLQWRKKFVGTKTAGEPASVEFVLPDGKRLKVEFHLYYCLYFLEGKPVFSPEYDFEQFAQMASQLDRTEQFFFLLAITDISEENQAFARKLIEERLSKLILYPSTVPVIARLLAEGKEELVQNCDYGEDFNFYKRSGSINIHNLPESETVYNNEESEIVEAIYYTEEEKDCFRVLVTDKSVRLYHRRKYGWYELPTPERLKKSENMELEERKKFAEAALRQFLRPQPELFESVSLEGMENEEKAEKIIEALRQREEYRRRGQSWEPYPWKQAEVTSALEDFFHKEGGFLTESYCLLHFGPEEKNRRVLYCGIVPYTVGINELDSDFASSYEFRVRELMKKIKEKHWIIGNFELKDIYTDKKKFEPTPFAVGESGTYYNFDVIHMHRADNLTSLLAKMFDFTQATKVEVYKGCLSFSCLDNTLEYCYGEEHLRKSMYSTDMTEADVFVRFTRTERKTEFARWMNGILADIPRVYMPLFIAETEKKNVFSLSLYDCRELSGYMEYKQVDSLMGENRKLIWKIWDDAPFIDTIQELVLWYMDYGKFGWKLKSTLKIDARVYSLSSKDRQSDKSKDSIQNRKYLSCQIYKNVSGVINAIKNKTVMTAYSLEVEKKEKPSLFDSKIGGLPYWEPQREYPEDSNGKKLALLAQINLDKNPMEELLPGGGMLQFFGAADEIFSKDFGSRENQEQYRVIYHEKINYQISAEELTELGIPDSTKTYKFHTPVSRELFLKAEKNTVYMGPEDYRFEEELKTAIEQEFDIKTGKEISCFNNLLGGDKETDWEFLNRDEAYEMKTELSNNGFCILGYPAFASNRKDPRGENEELQKYDRLLFQFDVHYMGDDYYYKVDDECGIASFFINSEDLKNQNFDRVMYNWECCCEDYDEDDYDEEDWDDEGYYDEDWDDEDYDEDWE